MGDVFGQSSLTFWTGDWCITHSSLSKLVEELHKRTKIYDTTYTFLFSFRPPRQIPGAFSNFIPFQSYFMFPSPPSIRNQKAYCDGQAREDSSLSERHGWRRREFGQKLEWKPPVHSPAVATIASSVKCQEGLGIKGRMVNIWQWHCGGPPVNRTVTIQPH